MLKAIVCTSIALLFFFLFPLNIRAQITPTNSATISGSVSDSSGKLIAGVKISLGGPRHASTQSDAQGLFAFVGVPFGTYQLTATAENLGTVTRAISVQGDTNVAIQYEPTQAGLKVIANVATSASAQFNITPASITQVDPMANAFEGKTSWRTILEQIPGVAQAGLGNGASFYDALPDSPLMPMMISIDGTLPYETATLLDDMPLIGSSLNFNNGDGQGLCRAGNGTDLGSYPLNGFSSSDVVRGPGANAPSIVDSIGGSFVLHSPSMVSANHYNFSMSTDLYGGIITNALAAFRWKKLSAVVTYGVNDSPGPIHGAALVAPGFFNTPSTVDGESFTAYSPPCFSPCVFGGYILDPRYNGFVYTAYQTGLLTGGVNATTAWSQHSGSVALTYALSPVTTAEVFYAGQTSNQLSYGQDRTYDFMPPAGYTGGIPSGQYFINLATCFFDPTYLSKTSSLLEEKITTQIGAGTLRLAALQNRTFAQCVFSQPSSQNVQLYGAGYLSGSSSLTYFNGGTYATTYAFTLGYNEYQKSDNRDLLLNYVIPLRERANAGVSFVKSYYNMPFQQLCYFGGALGSNITIPSDISQTTNELRFFIGGNPSERTSVQLSAYFVNADYHVPNPIGFDPSTYTSSNGSTDSRYTYAAPRLGFVWRPNATIAVRAAIGGGFAEAALGDLLGSDIPTFSPVGGYYQVTRPNLHLEPEKSFGIDLGADIRLRQGILFSFDIYRTNLFGQIYNSTTNSTIIVNNITYPLYVTQYGNLGESRYEGILIDVHHDVPRGMYWSASGGLTRGYVVSVPAGFYNNASCPAPAAPCGNVNVVPNVNFNGTFTGVSVPYSQGLGMVGYRWKADKYIDIAGTYFGSNNTYFRPAFVEFDGHVGYGLSKSTSLLVAFRNITGIYDNPFQIFSAATFTGAPTVSGAPSVLYQEMYAPRTVQLTVNIHS